MYKLEHFTLIGTLCLGAALPLSAAAEVETVPVAATAATGEITGAVVVVNTEKRLMTIREPEGGFKVIHVPPEVQRLDEVKINDTLSVSYLEAVAVDLQKGSAEAAPATLATKEVERVPGKKPEGSMVEEITVTGTIEAVDKARSVVTIRGPEEAVTATVEDPALLHEVAPGDTVTLTYIHAVAAKIKAAPQPKTQTPRHGKF